MTPDFEVVSPIGDARDAAASEKKTFGAAPLDSLNGKKLGLVWTEFYNGDTVLRAFREHLGKCYPDLQFVEMAPGRGLSWGDHPHASIAELGREHGIHGAVIAAGC
jgi:hypothetical protein